MTSEHGTFEDRLLDHLRRVVAERPAPERAARRPRRLPLAGAGVAVAGGAAAVAVVLAAGGGSDPAFAVTPRADGAVSVHLGRLDDAATLERRLRAAGVPAVVRFGGACTAPAPPAAGGSKVRPSTVPRPPHVVRPPHAVRGEAGKSFSTGGAVRGGGVRSAAVSALRTGADGATFTIDPATLRRGEHVYITGDRALTTLAVGTGAGATCPPAPGR